MDDPFDDEPDKYAKYNYNIGQIHAMALKEIFESLQRLHFRMKEHENAHAAASRAALAGVEMPPTADQPKAPN